MIFKDSGFEPLRLTSGINAKFVKCVHSHLMVPTSFPANVLQPSLDQTRKESPDIYISKTFTHNNWGKSMFLTFSTKT